MTIVLGQSSRSARATAARRLLSLSTTFAVASWMTAALPAQTPVPRPFPGSGGVPAQPRQADPERRSPPPATDPPPAADPLRAPAPGSSGAGAGRAAAPAAAQPAGNGAPDARATRPNPDAAALGTVPIYPTADFLESFDAGSGQRYHLYGTNQPYEEIVAYYRNVLDDNGREIYRTPAIRQFDLGRFDEQRMAFPPSVVVKDYAGNNSPGYLFIDGTTETRYRTIIQVVPPAQPGPR